MTFFRSTLGTLPSLNFLQGFCSKEYFVREENSHLTDYSVKRNKLILRLLQLEFFAGSLLHEYQLALCQKYFFHWILFNEWKEKPFSDDKLIKLIQIIQWIFLKHLLFSIFRRKLKVNTYGKGYHARSLKKYAIDIRITNENQLKTKLTNF